MTFNLSLQRIFSSLSCRISSHRPRDQNPGITDLSDPNRPLKLAEKVSELYDNEWTNAMENLESLNITEEKGIMILLRIIKVGSFLLLLITKFSYTNALLITKNPVVSPIGVKSKCNIPYIMLNKIFKCMNIYVHTCTDIQTLAIKHNLCIPMVLNK